jgi:dihydrofolate reductase
MIIGIVAISKNFAIGRDGKLPWHYSADLKFFKETTTGNAVVMGANTWRSIGRPLPDRLNIVLSRSKDLNLPAGVKQLTSKAAVIDLARDLDHDVFIIGGARTYAAFADLIEKWIVTDIPAEITDADAFMPNDFLEAFELVEKREIGDELRVRILKRR